MTKSSPGDAGAPAVQIKRLIVRYGGFTAIDELSVTLPGGTIVGLIGPNGAGKTTLLNAISGFTNIADGSVYLGREDITSLSIRQRARRGVIRGFQTVRLLERETVLTNVLVGAERLHQPSPMAQLLALPAQGRAHQRDRQAADEVLELLGLTTVATRLVSELPFASRRLVEVARVLITWPPVILLDEPAAGLDQEGRQELATVLQRVHATHPCTMVVVEHDVDLVKSLCSHVVALDSGRLLSTGDPESVFNDPDVRLAYFGRAANADA